MDPVDLLQELIRIDSSGGNDGACVRHLGQVLSRGGVEPTFLALEPERPNLVARLPGRREAPPLLLYGHVDVVPASPEGWSRTPFSGDLVDGEMWGRGALDMKAGVAMLGTAFLDTAHAGLPPGDVILILTVDEETGSRAGMGFLVDRHPELFAGVRYALSEFGGFTQWHGSRRFAPIQVAEKQRCLIRATATGPGGHAASVVADTAAEKLARLLARLTTRRLPLHASAPARLMLDAIASHLPVHERLGFRALRHPMLGRLLLPLLGADGRRLEPLLRNTATPTVIDGGTATNVIPTEITVEIDGRVLPGLTPGTLLDELRALVGDLARFELASVEPAAPAEPDLGLFDLLAGVLREHDPDCLPIPMLLPGYTDARHVARLGIQTYGYLPMRLPRTISAALIHAVDERVPASEIAFGAACIADVIQRYR